MIIAHIADAHLGFRAYGKYTQQMNAREADFYRTFIQTVKEIRQCHPDLMLIAGDLYDKRKPPNLAQIVAGKLKQLNIPIVVIPGNHDDASPFDKSPVEVLAGENITVVTESQRIKVNTSKGPVSIICVPYGKPIPPGNADILLIHCATSGVEEFKHVDSIHKIDQDRYKYIAGGHLHRHFVKGKLVYPGSLERRNFSEEGFVGGYVMIHDWKPTFYPVRSRELLTVRNIKDLPQKLDGKIIRLLGSFEFDLDIGTLKKRAFHVICDTESEEMLVEEAQVTHGTLLERYATWCQEAGKVEFLEPGAAMLKEELEKI